MLRLVNCARIFEILLINISTVRLCDSAMRRYWTIASLYQKFIVFTVWAYVSINTNKKVKQIH